MSDSKKEEKDSDSKAANPKPWRKWLKRALLLSPVAVLVLWMLIHRVPWLGPVLADTLRSIIGVDNVSRLQDFAYGMQDRFNRSWRSEEKPKAYWDVPSANAPATAPTASASVTKGCSLSPFKPADVGPVHKSWSAPGDGQWVALTDPRAKDAPPVMYKTLLHPDKFRSWAAVSVVAIDRRQVALHMMAGRHEPKSRTKESKQMKRPALIPKAHHDSLLAAFNGGFKAEHGYYGMRLDGITIIKARPKACFIAMFGGDKIEIGSYERLKDKVKDALWWRQTPACMVDNGTFHPGLVSDKNTYWGATLDGNTVIRRSALGLSKDGQILYSGIGDHTTAKAIATAMKHVGAHHVAQLDVNWSYPKFVLYEPRSSEKPELIAKKLCDGFEFSEDQFIRKREPRDFFFLTKKSAERIASEQCAPPKASAPASAASVAPAAPSASASSAEAPQGPSGGSGDAPNSP